MCECTVCECTVYDPPPPPPPPSQSLHALGLFKLVRRNNKGGGRILCPIPNLDRAIQELTAIGRSEEGEGGERERER